MAPPPEFAASLSAVVADCATWADPCDRADTVEKASCEPTGLTETPVLRALTVWTSSASESRVPACTAVVLPGLAPHRGGASKPSKESVSPEDSAEEAAKVALAPPSALGGVPSASLRTSSAELTCSNCFEAQLPAVRQGALRTGAEGFIEPLDVLAVEGVPVAGGVNPVTLILSRKGWSDFPTPVYGSSVAGTHESDQRKPRQSPYG